MSDIFMASYYDVRLGPNLHLFLEEAMEIKKGWRYLFPLRYWYPELLSKVRKSEHYVELMESMLEVAWDHGDDLNYFEIDDDGTLKAEWH